MFAIILNAFTIGLTGIITQTLLIRELLSILEGNELSLGIIFSSWLLFESVGSLYLARKITSRKNKIFIFSILQIFFIFSSFTSLYFTRIIKNLFGINFGVGISFQYMFFVVTVVMFLPSLLHGTLYTFLAEIFAENQNKLETSIPNTYIYELFGTILGGIIFTFLLIKQLSSFQIVFLMLLFHFFGILFLGIYKNAKYPILISLALSIFIFISTLYNLPSKIEKKSLQVFWKDFKLLEYKNSVYGKIAVVEKDNQKNVYYNCLPIFTIPTSDKIFQEELVHIPFNLVKLDEQKENLNVLLIYGGLSGILYEILKYKNINVDYVEPDALLIDITFKFLIDEDKKNFKKQNINIYNIDPRIFVKKQLKKYDIVIIGLKGITDLNTNKLFTYEFFKLLKTNLRDDSIVAFTTIGSLVYLHKDLVLLNSIIYNTASSIFKFVNIIPGDSYNIFLCSDSELICNFSPQEILFNLKLNNIKSDILTQYYLEYRFNENIKKQFIEKIKKLNLYVNYDFIPNGLISTLRYWSVKNSSMFFEKFVNLFFNKINIMYITGLILLIIFVFFLYLLFVNKDPFQIRNCIVFYSIFTTGYSSMFMNILLMFLFQIFYGYVYYLVGVLNSLFMIGLILGTYLSNRIIKKMNLLFYEMLIFFVIFLILSTTHLLQIKLFALYVVYMFIFIFVGVVFGLEIPVFNRLLLNPEITVSASRIFGLDTLGGWLGGILGGTVLLFVLGVKESIIFLLAIKSFSIFILLFYNNEKII